MEAEDSLSPTDEPITFEGVCFSSLLFTGSPCKQSREETFSTRGVLGAARSRGACTAC